MKIINIMGGGPPSLVPPIEKFMEEEWVGVDRGTVELLKRGIKPIAAFGDFDSVSIEELAGVKAEIPNLAKYKPEKDETDMELALIWALEQEPDCIRLFGASGGRIDHSLANIQLVEKYAVLAPQSAIYILDNRNAVWIKGPGTYQVHKDSTKKYISFLPSTETVKGLTLKGFKYPLVDQYVEKGSTLCISNELLEDSGTFSFSEGILIIIRSND
ncbi:thiamine pyrophosphokinase [Bacillus sp. FJAT-27225]|uniref:thiamine diphosphokinase n=1 Tax=Bacillus sp. FJAT-27225 TaxID=1743144 RepID=UPI00080C21EF|nr:thiamine diphosphokinase [Bacillus sp. FJAT-27225]OCA85489.1 thiamine pyrophosphokinase [Bacillus sp. FJAT-27225]